MRCEPISQWRARVREGENLFGCDLCHISVLVQSSICICRDLWAARPSTSNAHGESSGRKSWQMLGTTLWEITTYG